MAEPGTVHNGDAPEQRIIHALSAVHNSRTSNAQRQEASQLLRQAEDSPDAIQLGFALASASSHDAAVRHFGLSTLEHVVRHNWEDFSEEAQATVRPLVLRLAEGLSADDPIYIRNKVASLWTVLAERTWAITWMDMDENLVQLWNATNHHKSACLTILDSLAEDVFARDDATALLRTSGLNRECLQIFTPKSVSDGRALTELDPQIRYGDQGWLSRITAVLLAYGSPLLHKDEQTRGLVISCLGVLRTMIPYSTSEALGDARLVEALLHCLHDEDSRLTMATMDTFAILTGTRTQHLHILLQLVPVYSQHVLLQQVFARSEVDVNDIDFEKYSILKRITEVVSRLGLCITSDHVRARATSLPEFMKMVTTMAEHPSLDVSMPIVYMMSKLFADWQSETRDLLMTVMGPCMKLCAERLMRYDLFSEDSQDPSVIYATYDNEDYPERHAMIGNYRKYCKNTIECIGQRMPYEASEYVIALFETFLQTHDLSNAAPEGQPYRKNSELDLLFQARISGVESAARGFGVWKTRSASQTPEQEERRVSIEDMYENWYEVMLALDLKDPAMRQKVLQAGASAASLTLSNRSAFVLKVLENLLDPRYQDRNGDLVYNEACRDLQTACTLDLQRMAWKMPDKLMEVYSPLEARVNQLLQHNILDWRGVDSYEAFLFIIVHRASSIPAEVKFPRLQAMIQPLLHAWVEPKLNETLASRSAFYQMLGLEGAIKYLLDTNAMHVSQWETVELNQDGQEVQKVLNTNSRTIPLRRLKLLLGCSCERIEKQSEQYRLAQELWHDQIMGILPNLLALLTYAHAFHNPLSWSESNPDALKLVNRVLMDRFWQAGISTGSKDEFLKRISSTKSTVEGLASSLRSVIRNIRDYCYSALVSLSKIDPAFYQIFGLAEALATALFTDARHLSTHQMSLLLSTSFGIIGECPLESRDAFLGPMIKALLKFVDEKVSTEWDRIALRKTHRTEGESLTDEMREESILRQFTYAAIMIVANILDPEPHKTLPKSQASSSKTPPANAPRVRDFVLSSPPLIELILQFAAHCILVPDTRSCNTILRVLHSITIHFTLPNDPVHSAVREFLSENILKACITAYNDPYFVDCQRDLSMLIMAIYRYYGDLTPTPRNIFASLPGVAGARQERMERRMTQSHSDKVWRAAVVECLAGLKGVSISEMGRLTGSEVLDKRKDEKKVLKEKDEERRREAARLRTIETQAEIDEL